MARRCYAVFIVFLLKLQVGQCDVSSDEAAPKELLGDEYQQIFHNLPTLFEYLLDILQERPEILEKDDITFFQEEPEETCEGGDKIKRGVKEPCDNNLTLDEYPNFEADVKSIAIDFSDNAKDTNIDSENYLGDVTTEMSDDNSKESRDGFDNKQNSNNIKSETHNKIGGNDKAGGKKRNVNFDSFLGSIDWNKFMLSPEEVEELALKTERDLEEHNKKKER